MEELRKTMKNLSQDSWSLGHNLNLGPLEYEAGLLTTDHDVWCISYGYLCLVGKEEMHS
jgi:hypothetical protein